MLQFKQSDTAAVMILTLSESVSVTEPYYLFVFHHILTKSKVKFVKFTSQDESNSPQRYNQFTIDATAIFLDAPVGQWNYTVYEQLSATNTDEGLTGAVLEYGKLILNRETEFEFKMYNELTTYNAYNG